MEANDNKKSLTIVEVIDDGPLKISGNIVLKDLKRDIIDNPSRNISVQVRSFRK